MSSEQHIARVQRMQALSSEPGAQASPRAPLPSPALPPVLPLPLLAGLVLVADAPALDALGASPSDPQPTLTE